MGPLADENYVVDFLSHESKKKGIEAEKKLNKHAKKLIDEIDEEGGISEGRNRRGARGARSVQGKD